MRKIIAIFCCCISLLQAQSKEDFLKDQVCNLLPSLEGWCSQEKALHFIELVLEVKPELCVEIGVFGGSSLFPVASALKFLGKGMIAGIDPWERSECIRYFDPVEEHADFVWWSNLNFDYVFNSYRSMLKRFGLSDFCITIKSTSERAAMCFRDIDILHIDGNHDAEVSLMDAKLYLPLVRSGGYIWINEAMNPKRQATIDWISGACDFIEAVDTGNCLLFKKR